MESVIILVKNLKSGFLRIAFISYFMVDVITWPQNLSRDIVYSFYPSYFQCNSFLQSLEILFTSSILSLLSYSLMLLHCQKSQLRSL